MSRSNQVGLGLALHIAKSSVKTDTFITVKHWRPRTNLHIPISDGKRNRENLIAAPFPLAHPATNSLECLKEKGFNKVRLKPLCLHTLHVLADGHDLVDIHSVRRESLLIQKLF